MALVLAKTVLLGGSPLTDSDRISLAVSSANQRISVWSIVSSPSQLSSRSRVRPVRSASRSQAGRRCRHQHRGFSANHH